NATPAELRSRSRLLGVNLNATYSMLRGSFARPYLLGGVGVLTTREVVPVVSSVQPLAGNPQIMQVTYRSESRDHAELGLNAAAVGQLVEHVLEQRRHHGVQAAGADVLHALVHARRSPSDLADAVVGEREQRALRLDQRLVLLGERVLGLRHDADEVVLRERL